MKFIKVSIIGVVGLLVLVSLAAYGQIDPAATDPAAKAVVDANGNLRVPADYRTSYQFLGSWAVADAAVKTPDQLHIVYASPGTIAAYRRDKRFPDGSVLVKEVFQTATGPMKTGTVSRAQTLKGWFVMVKDSKDTHRGNALWGDGWAWSWFDAGNPLETTSANYRVNCLPCHVPAQATDWIYVQGYPPLVQAH
jgi:cytochrome P460